MLEKIESIFDSIGDFINEHLFIGCIIPLLCLLTLIIICICITESKPKYYEINGHIYIKQNIDGKTVIKEENGKQVPYEVLNYISESEPKYMPMPICGQTYLIKIK